jgi:hypothetical protein
MRKALPVACVVLLLAAVTRAQDNRPNFSGTWNLDVAKSDFGGAPAPESIVHVMEHKDPNLKVTSTQKNQQGELTNVRTLTTDGKENINKMRTMAGDQDVKSTSTWNGRKLANAMTLDIQGNAIEINEVWDLSEDGKILNVVRDIKTGQGDFHQTYVYNKQ